MRRAAGWSRRLAALVGVRRRDGRYAPGFRATSAIASSHTRRMMALPG